MKSMTYEESVQRGIEHVGDRWADRAISYLNEGKGSREGCLSGVLSHAEAQSLMAWFRKRDLFCYKQWAYVAAKTQRMCFQIEPGAWFPTYKHLYALLSDNEDMVKWYRQHKVSYCLEDEIKNKDNPRKATFHGYQIILALNGEWELLERRCEQILSANLNKDRKYLIDHRFYLALARGEKAEMESVLNELTSPKIARVRNFEPAFAFTENLIATHATIYAKIAWRYGYEIEVDSPWVPKEWLPVQPLEKYEDPWPFMQDFDLYQPFDGGWAPWSPN